MLEAKGSDVVDMDTGQVIAQCVGPNWADVIVGSLNTVHELGEALKGVKDWESLILMLPKPKE